MISFLFYDVEGVLVTEASSARARAENPGRDYELVADVFDHDAIAQFHRIVDETGALPVCSSSWRTIIEHRRQLIKHGVHIWHRFLRTPSLRSHLRGQQIAEFLDERGLNPDTANYAVLEDEPWDMDNLPKSKIVHIENGRLGRGLTAKHADRAIEILSRSMTQNSG